MEEIIKQRISLIYRNFARIEIRLIRVIRCFFTTPARKNMEEIIRQLLDRVTNLELALREMQTKEEKQKKNESSPCTPSKKEKEEKEERFVRSNAHAREKKIFTAPTAEEVQAYLDKIGETRFDGIHFVDYYDSTGWVIGNDRPMKNWRAAIRCWRTYYKDHVLHMKKGSSQPAATPQFHETEELLRKREAEEASAVSYQEYLRQKRAGMIGKGGQG